MTGQVSGDDVASRGKQGRTDRRAARVAQNRSWAGGNSGWGTHLVLRTVCAASSSLENFLEGPNMRAPPCSSCPLAGAQVGLCAVVIGRALDLCDLISSGDALIIFSHLIFPPRQRFLARPFAKGKAPWSRSAQMPPKRARVDSSPKGYPDVMNPKPRGEGLPGLTRSRHEASHSVITPESRVWCGLPGWDSRCWARISLRRR